MQRSHFRLFKIVSIIFLLQTSFSCREVFQDDLSDSSVSIIIPQNNTRTSIRNVHFKWDELEGATDYSLEIVSPSFSNIFFFDIDSTISGNEIFIDLVPGDYQWRIRANNNGSRTEFTLPRNLTIDSTSNLTGQTVVLASPLDNLISNSSFASFSWNQIAEADDYDFVLKEGSDFNSGVTVASSFNTTSNTFTYAALEEKVYSWGVRAKNSVPSLTNYSTRTLSVDTTKPNEPSILGLPANNSLFTIGDTVDFTWSLSSDIGGTFKSNIVSVIEYSTDSLFPASLTSEITSTLTSSFRVFNIAGTYYWRMFCKDDAGNESDFNTITREFTVR